ncbi:hypothetical protein H0H93_001872 [Arthromyces matolae]|nr:hypothetical protein H0H93_001872 [Arthromyces matolae]
MPALWLAIMAGDDSLDAHEVGVTLVASRNPFRESGPPANMAKLILLRQKLVAHAPVVTSGSNALKVPNALDAARPPVQ